MVVNACHYSNRVEAGHVLPVIAALTERGAMYHRNASGAQSLAYVAAGRLPGYVDEHMNAWDDWRRNLHSRNRTGPFSAKPMRISRPGSSGASTSS